MEILKAILAGLLITVGIFSLIIMLSMQFVHADEGLYIEAGISLHNIELDSPEINLPSELGNFGIGYNIKLTTKDNIDIYFKHTSALFYTESGYGLNQIGIQYRRYIK
jgi:hypothetical protein